MSFSEWVSSITKELPLVEKNVDRQPRPITFKNCSIEFKPDQKKSKRKTWLSKTMRAFSHWALEIGDYSYDLKVGRRDTCRYLVSCIPYASEDIMVEFNLRALSYTHGTWTVGKNCKEGKSIRVGTTSLSDTEIDELAESIVHSMNLRGGFHKINNNCQTFSKEIADIIDPHCRLDRYMDTSKTMGALNTIARNAALCAQDALTEFRIKEMPKSLERFFDDESYEDTDRARRFLEGVTLIGAKAELIGRHDPRWSMYTLREPQCLAPLFERKGIYTFSDAQTIEAYKQRMIYGAGGAYGPGVNIADWADSRNNIKLAQPPSYETAIGMVKTNSALSMQSNSDMKQKIQPASQTTYNASHDHRLRYA